jgi:hypothetical protein
MRCIPALFSLSVAALAQSNFATISGRIEDPAHQPLDRAQVTITAKDTGAVRTLTSNSDGLFEAVNLMPGDYLRHTSLSAAVAENGGRRHHAPGYGEKPCWRITPTRRT